MCKIYWGISKPYRNSEKIIITILVGAFFFSFMISVLAGAPPKQLYMLIYIKNMDTCNMRRWLLTILFPTLPGEMIQSHYFFECIEITTSLHIKNPKNIIHQMPT